MATITRAISVNLGASKTGQAANLYYTVYSTDKTTVLKARTNTGVTEFGTSGSYAVSVDSWDTTWGGIIVWDISSTIITQESFDPIAVQLDLTQTLTLTTGATVGGALSSALTRFLKQVVVGVPGQSGSSLKIYKADGTTLLATIDLSTVNQAIP